MSGDAELLEAWRGGDRDAGDQLIQKHFSSVCRFFRNRLGDDVEDLVQRTFLDCVEKRDKVSSESFRGYLFSIARNRLFDHLRTAYRQPAQVDLGSHSVADLGTSPSGIAARNEEEALLQRAMRSVSIDHQIALELAYWEGLSGRDIAAVLDIAENTVRSRLARARDALRSQVERLAAEPRLRQTTLQSLDAQFQKSEL